MDINKRNVFTKAQARREELGVIHPNRSDKPQPILTKPNLCLSCNQRKQISDEIKYCFTCYPHRQIKVNAKRTDWGIVIRAGIVALILLLAIFGLFGLAQLFWGR